MEEKKIHKERRVTMCVSVPVDVKEFIVDLAKHEDRNVSFILTIILRALMEEDKKFKQKKT